MVIVIKLLSDDNYDIVVIQWLKLSDRCEVLAVIGEVRSSAVVHC